jgi:hypothetical protein
MAKWAHAGFTESCCEVHGTRKEDYTPQSFEGSVTLRVPYNKRFKLINGIYLNDVPWPSVPHALLRSASVVPVPQRDNVVAGTDNQVFDYLEALVTLQYSTNERSEYFVETFEPQVEFQILPPDNFHWNANPTPPAGRQLTAKEAPGRQVRGPVYTVKWLHRQSVPAAYYEGAGYTNHATHVGVQISRAWLAEIMLYMPGGVEPSFFIDPAGSIDDPPQRGYDYTCKFLIRENGATNGFGWNHYYRADSTAANDEDKYERIYNKKASAASVVFMNYPTKDLTSILPS